MKKMYLVIVTVLLFTATGISQSVTMSNTAQSATCSGTYYDPGGTANYANNSNYVQTFTPSAGSRMQFTFSSFNTESGYDFLYIYNGNSTSATLIGKYSGTQIAAGQTFISTANDGSLTFRFTSDGGTVKAGWVAAIACVAVPYREQFISMNTGVATWCAGETRNVSVTVKNTGSLAWTDASPDINIGAKWNADADYLVRVNAGGLAPAATQTYYFTMTAPATAGTNNLTFDVVEEGVSWFGDNAGGIGPGNSKYVSPAITITSLPAAVTVSGAGTFCGSTTLTASNGGSGTMYFQGTTSGGTLTGTPASSALITNSGTYYFRALSAGGCWGPEGSAAVTINPLPAATTVSGAGTFCNSTTITASNGGDGTIYFEGTTSNGISTATPATSQVIASSGTYYFRARSASGCWGTQGSALVTINSAPSAVTVTGGGSFCASSTTINASGGAGGTIYFQGNTSGGTSTAVPATSQVITSSGTYYFRAYNSCGWGAEGSVTVTINPLPAAVTVSGAGIYCTSASITADNGGSGTIYFEGTTPNGTSIATPSTSQLITAPGTYYFRAQSAAGCWGTQGSAVISISQPPTLANAGPDQVGTPTCGLTTVTLAGNAPVNGTGAWSIVSGTGGSVANNANRNSTFTGISGSTYVLRWTISNSPCLPSSDDVTITFNKPPTALITTTPAVCYAGNTGTATVVAAGGTAPYTYLWNNGQTTSTATNLAAGTYSVVVTDGKGCTVSGTTTVTQPTQVVADAGPDQTICSGTSTSLGGIPTATGGTGTYTYAWSPSIGLSSASVANPTATPGITKTYSVIVTDASGCSSAANSATITMGSGTKTWIGDGAAGGSGTDDNFNNLRNWSPAGVPGACNDVVMNLNSTGFIFGNTVAVTINNSVTIKSLSTTLSGTAIVSFTPTVFELYVANNNALTVTGNTSIATNMNVFIFGAGQSIIAAGNNSVITYGGNLTTTISNNNNTNFPFVSATNNTGKFYVNGNASLAGIGNDYGNKPAQVIFDGATGITQTISQNSGSQAILLGATSTDIGQTNSPKVVLAGAGSGGFQSIGNLNINNTSTLDAGTVQTINRYAAGGTLTLSGGAYLKLGASSGGQTGSNFPLNYSTINLNSAAAPTSTVEYYGAAAQTIFNTPLYGNLTLSGASTKTAGGALTIKGDATINTTGDIFAGSNYSHSLAGNWYNNVSSNAFTSTGLLTCNGTAAQTIGGTSGSTFYNLTINNAAGVSLAQGQLVNNALTLNLGNLNISNQNLTMGSTAPAIAGTFSATRMIIADGGGQVRKNYTAIGTYTFPIGDNTGTPEYSPITINLASGAFVAGAYAGVKVTNAKHPANNSPSDYINRYWSVSNNGITSPVYTVTSTYVQADISGTEANIVTGKYPGTLPWIMYSPANIATHSLTATGITTSGSIDISGLAKAPTVSVTGGGVTICLGASTGLTTTVTSSSALTYSWTGQGISSSSSPNITVTPNAAGPQVYTVIVTDQNGLTATASVTVNVSAPAVLLAAPVNVTSCAGSAAIFTVSASSTGLLYQWQVSTNNGTSYSDIAAAPYTGFNSANLTITAPSVGMAGNLYRVIITPQSPCNILITTPGKLSFKNLWTGTISNDWNNGANWSDGNTPSISCPDVTILAGTPFQPVLGTGTAAINNINILPLASVTVSNATLQIAGSITNNGTFNVSSGTIELNGSSAQVIAANTFMNHSINDLIISNTSASGVTLNDSLDVYHSLTYGLTGTQFATNGHLTLKSTMTQTAYLGDMTGHTITGDVTVERYIATGSGSAPNHGKSWQLLAVPTQGQTIKQSWGEGATATNISEHAAGSAGNPVAGYGTMLTGSLSNAVSQGFDAYTAPGASIKVYNTSTGNYDFPVSTSLPVYNQKGYFIFVRGDRSVYTSTGAATPTVLRTKGILFTPANPAPVTNVAANRSESIGNPFAAPIDMRLIARTGGVTEFFQVWDPRLGGAYNYGAFQTFYKDGNDYYVTPGGGSYGSPAVPSNYIQSGQAFFVQTDTMHGGTVSISEAAKACNSTFTSMFTRQAGSDNGRDQSGNLQSQLRTSLYSVNTDGSAGNLIDGVLSSFNDLYSNSVDAMDARKSANTGENLSIKTAGKLLAIERKHTIVGDDTIFLNLTSVRVQQYLYHFDAQNMNGAAEGFVEDNYTHTRTPLSLNGITDVSFKIENIPGSYAADRFRIVFSTLKVLPVTFTSVKAYKENKHINIEWKVNNEINIKQYEVEKSADGKVFTALVFTKPMANNGGAAAYTVQDANPFAGSNYYRIKSVDINGAVSFTSIVKVASEDTKQDINIYPNPITDGQIHLHLFNQPEGKYYLRLLNNLGQVVLEKEVSHENGTATEFIKWDFNLAHGMYKLEITRPDGEAKLINVLY